MSADFLQGLSAFLSRTFGLGEGAAAKLALALVAGAAWFALRWVWSHLPLSVAGSGPVRNGGDRRKRVRQQARRLAATGDKATAARHLELAGDGEAARKLREGAAAEARSTGEWSLAAEHLDALGRPGEAGRLLVKARRFEAAAALLRKAGLGAEAARALESGDKLPEAAEGYLAAGRDDDALRCLTRACSSRAPAALRPRREELALHAARLARKLGRHGATAELLELAGRHEPAARFHALAGEHARAAQLYEAAGDWAAAAECFTKTGDPEGARRCGARAAREAGKNAEAAELFESGDELLEAGECWAAEGEAARAAACFAAVGSWGGAAAWYRRAGQTLAAAECHERAGDAFEAGQLFAETDEPERALAALAEVRPGDERFLEARGLAGLLRARRGEHAASRVLLEQVVDGLDAAGLSPPELPAYLHALADGHEADGDCAGALARLRRAAMLAPSWGEVATRIERLDEILRREGGRGGQELAPERYQVLRELATGGMGKVLVARDLALERFVALKVLSEAWQEHPELRARFVREARVAAKLSHPNVVSVHDVGEIEGRPYIALEYVEGRDLASLLAEHGRLSIAEAAPILQAIASALGAAHAMGIVHRDVKPGNVFLGSDGSIKLGDFGIARLEGADLTEAGVAIGTPRYMAPEQACGQAVDGRTDIYSLGVLTFRMLTGRPPFESGDLAYQHVHARPPDPREFEPSLPPLLAQLTLSCLAKQPDLRPPTAQRFAELLEAACVPVSAER